MLDPIHLLAPLGTASAFGLTCALLYPTIRDSYRFHVLPARAQRLLERGERDAAKTLLEFILKAPAARAQDLIQTRYSLGLVYKSEGDTDRAIAQFEALLQSNLSGMAGALQSEIRGQLADCLEQSERPDEAQVQRQAAAHALEGTGPRSFLWYVTQAQSLTRSGRHSDAADTYRAALEMFGAQQQLVVVIETRIKRSITLFKAGRFEESIAESEQAITEGASTVFLMLAHRQAAVSAQSLSRFEEAEAHIMASLGVAEAMNSADGVAECLAQLAGCQELQGNLTQAMQTADQAIGYSVKARPQVRAVQFECLMLWGRYEEATTLLESAVGSLGPSPVPHLGRRQISALSVAIAGGLAEQGKIDAARAWLNRVDADYARDERQGYAVAATRLLLDALADPTNATLPNALLHLDNALIMAANRAGERQNQGLREPLSILARVAYTLGDYERTARLWDRYEQAAPRPVYIPFLGYHRGQCREALGDRPGAITAYQQAVAPGIDTFHARQSQRRLDALAKEALQTPDFSA